MQHLIIVIATSFMLVTCNVDGINNPIDVPSSEIKLLPNSNSKNEQILEQEMNSLNKADKVEPLHSLDVDGNKDKVSLKYICVFS